MNAKMKVKMNEMNVEMDAKMNVEMNVEMNVAVDVKMNIEMDVEMANLASFLFTLVRVVFTVVSSIHRNRLHPSYIVSSPQYIHVVSSMHYRSLPSHISYHRQYCHSMLSLVFYC